MSQTLKAHPEVFMQGRDLRSWFPSDPFALPYRPSWRQRLWPAAMVAGYGLLAAGVMLLPSASEETLEVTSPLPQAVVPAETEVEDDTSRLLRRLREECAALLARLSRTPQEIMELQELQMEIQSLRLQQALLRERLERLERPVREE